MRSPLTALQAFAHDAGALASTDDARLARLPHWLAVAKAAEQVASLDASEQRAYVAGLSLPLPPIDDRPTLVHDVAPAPTEGLPLLAERFRRVAEDMERGGCFELAFTTVSSVCRFSTANAVAARAHATVHLGRIARQLGSMSTAEDCYQSVAEVGLRERDGPLVARALIGLGNLARTRGNRPLERDLFERAIAHAHPGGRTEADASIGLMNAAIDETRLIDALLHGWRAFDLTPATDRDLRAMILSNLAFTSLKAGFAKAALNGFREVLSMTETPRVRLTSLGGAVRAAAMLSLHEQVVDYDRAGEQEMPRAQIPFESARFLLYAGQAWSVLDEIDAATRRLRQSLSLSTDFRFHELAMRAELALATLARGQRLTELSETRWVEIIPEAEQELLVSAGIGRLESLSL